MRIPFNFPDNELLRVLIAIGSVFMLLLISAGRLAELLNPGVWPVVSAIIQLFGFLVLGIFLGGIYLRYRELEYGKSEAERAKERNYRDEILLLRELFQSDPFLKAYRHFERHHSKEVRSDKTPDPREARSAMVVILETFNLLRSLLEKDALDFKLVVDSEGYLAYRLRQYTRQLGTGNHWYEGPISEWEDAFETWNRLVDSWIKKVAESGRTPPGVTR